MNKLREVLRFFTLLVFIFIIGCNSSLKIIAKEKPLTHPLSKMDFPVYFGKSMPFECNDTLSAVSKIKIDNTYYAQTNDKETAEVEYYNDLTKKIEDFEAKGYKIIIPRTEIGKASFAIIIGIYPSGSLSYIFSNKIVGCVK